MDNRPKKPGRPRGGPKGGPKGDLFKRRPRPGDDRPTDHDRRPPHPGRGPEDEPYRPRIHDSLRPILRYVGTPEPTPFIPDPFQVEAVQAVEHRDVVVSAPTGSGKTYIAVEAARKVLARGGHVWYASPLKALSNSKFLEFGKIFGPNAVGLLTGDHKVNAEAPLIVGTTEILRNQLYDAMSRGENLATDLVVMDEAHYLGDQDRGVVWEETIIYLPARVRLLLLSATVANANEIADWLAFIRKEKAQAIVSTERPVPLYPLFLFPDGLLSPLGRGPNLAPQVRHFVDHNPHRGHRGGRTQTPYGRILKSLDQADLLPAIFFLKSRSDCDQALTHCFHTVVQDPRIEAKRNHRIDELVEKYPFLKDHPHLQYLRGPGVAAHHAGHLPHFKLVVEQLMQDGLLTAIFATSTVAAGVNFPARTVVVCQSDRFNGRDFQDLTATELLQMTGRAGRRGMDRVGFALVIPGPFQNVALVQSLFGAPPDPVLSRLSINFSMVLNLLSSHQPAQIQVLLDLSLATYQQTRSRTAKEMTKIMDRLMVLIAGGKCQGPEEALHLFTRRRALTDDVYRLRSLRPHLAWETTLSRYLVPGRVFEVDSGKPLCAVMPLERQGRPGMVAIPLVEDFSYRKGRLKERWVPMDRIGRLFETRLAIDAKTDPRKAARIIQDAARMDHVPLDPRKDSGSQAGDRLAELDARLQAAEAELAGQPCGECTMFKYCLGADRGEIQMRLRQLRNMESESQVLGRLLWSSFLRHLAMLKAQGFVSEDDRLTGDGEWAAQLRLDHPLVIAAGIRSRAWPEEDPVLLAALVAPFVVDKEMMAGETQPTLATDLTGAWNRMDQAVGPLVQILAAAGFPVPFLNPRSSAAIYSWARQGDWDRAVDLYGQDPGDMAMLVFRTSDNLRQMASLKETHPALAATARRAVELILKEPVTVPL